MARSTPRRRNLLSGAALVLLAVLFVAGVVLGDRTLRGARLDLTEDGLFTLSEGSRRIARSLDRPLTLRFYFSGRIAQEIPQIAAYAQRVRDLLEEFAELSDGRIELQVIDPEPFTEAEDRAVAFGLQGVPVDQSGEQVYFGLAGTNPTDDSRIIAFFDETRERHLEYDIARTILGLAEPERPEVGLITGLPIAGSPLSQSGRGPNDAWSVYNQMADFAEVRQISRSAAEMPDGTDAVVLVHPKGLTPGTLYAIDQFVLQGGRLLAFIDPHSEGEAQNPERDQFGRPQIAEGFASNLDPLLEAWGIEVPALEVAGDLGRARRVQVPDPSMSRNLAVDYPLWPALLGTEIDRDDLVTAELEILNFASPGHIRTVAETGVEVRPLVVTTANGGTVPVSMLQTQVDPVAVLNAFEPADAPLVLAARLTGEAATAFPDGPPEPPEEGEGEEAKVPEDKRKAHEAAKAAHIAKSAAPMNVMVVADVDMLADPMWARVGEFFGQRVAMPYAHNAALFINAIENFTGGEDLISLRSRGGFQRPFTAMREIQREAEIRFRAKERELRDKLEETERRLRTLEGGGEKDGGIVLTAEQRESIETFRTALVAIRRELRAVQYELRREVEALTGRLKAINIAFVPLLVAACAVGVAMTRRARRRGGSGNA